MSVFRDFTADFLSLATAVRRPDRPLRRAAALIRLGDALGTTRPRNWEARSRLAYRKATRILDRAEPTEPLAPAARALIRSRRRPLHLAALRLSLTLTALLVFLAGAALALPGVRSRLWPKDLAAGRPWSASSAYEGYADSGTGPSADAAFFHTRRERHPWVTIELEGTPAISSIRVDNRSDCCGVRALPLNIEVLDGDHYRLVCQRRAAFSTYTCNFPPLRTGSVRLYLADTGILHLKRVAVFE